MNREPMDDHLRRHYGSQRLDATTLERLKQLALLETPADAPKSPAVGSTERRRVASRVAGGAVAIAALALLLLVFPSVRGAEADGSAALTGSIAREIAVNHGKNLDVEFPADGYPELRRQMGKLDFSLRSPRRISGGGLQMLGGRYCSIQGHLAAQIKLQDEAGRVLTLYETGFSEDFEGFSDQPREQDGFQIRIWREGDMLFGLAGSEL